MSVDPVLPLQHPHRRYNALTGEWILVCPQRTQRPWGGRREPTSIVRPPPHDPECYLCPGNRRTNGDLNPHYESTYVFNNDFPALLPDGESGQTSDSVLLNFQAVLGECRVICYSPRHDLTLADMSPERLRGVIDVWASQEEELRSHWKWVQIFENKGELMGCSNPHPHGQIWAGDFVPNEPAAELQQQRLWFEGHRSSLLLDYAEREWHSGERVVASNAHWLAVVPWWAVWPFETLLLPRRSVGTLSALSAEERAALADTMQRLLQRYDRLFDTPFPYSFGWHSAPGGTQEPETGHQLHAHFYPPLLRSAHVKKFMVGYELLAEAQRDISPEQAAAWLRDGLKSSHARSGD